MTSPTLLGVWLSPPFTIGTMVRSGNATTDFPVASPGTLLPVNGWTLLRVAEGLPPVDASIC